MALRPLSLLTVALIAVSVAGAAQHSRPGHYYLSLGDSLAYGIQPDKAERGLPPSGFRTGYTDVVAARLRALNPNVEVVNYGCPSESTTTFAHGRCEWLTEGKRLHDPFRTTQMQAALAFLRAHKGQVSPITLTLWGNDVFPALETCKDFACIQSRAPKVVASFSARFGRILKQLRAAAPGATMVVTGAWNFDADHVRETKDLYRRLNTAMRANAAAVKALFADVQPLFNPPGSAAAYKARVCAYSFICSKDDPHPTDAGYRAYAAAILVASGF